MRTPFTRTNVVAVLGLHLECVTELLLSNSGSMYRLYELIFLPRYYLQISVRFNFTFVFERSYSVYSSSAYTNHFQFTVCYTS